MPSPLPNAPFLAGAMRRAVLLMAVSGPALAAGGHFTVDDAALLDPGQCQIEGWVEHESRADRRVAHVGPNCGLGPVEAGLGWDRSRLRAVDAPMATSAYVKWAVGITDAVGIGATVAGNWQAAAPRYAGTTILIPVSWRIDDALHAHVNIGRDYPRGGTHANRAGVAVEWRPAARWLVIAEQFRQSEASFARIGLRWEPTKALGIDLSRADRWSGPSSAWWTLGISWTFEQRVRPASEPPPGARRHDAKPPVLALVGPSR
jgi:hypothetical protein